MTAETFGSQHAAAAADCSAFRANSAVLGRTSECGTPGQVLRAQHRFQVRGIYAVTSLARLLRNAAIGNRSFGEQPGDFPGHVCTALPPYFRVPTAIDERFPYPAALQPSRFIDFCPETIFCCLCEMRTDLITVFNPTSRRSPTYIFGQRDGFKVRGIYAKPRLTAAFSYVINLAVVRNEFVGEYVSKPVRQKFLPVRVKHSVSLASAPSGPQPAALGSRRFIDLKPETILNVQRSLRFCQFGRPSQVPAGVVPRTQSTCFVWPVAVRFGTTFRSCFFRWQDTVPPGVHVVRVAQAPSPRVTVAVRFSTGRIHAGDLTLQSNSSQSVSLTVTQSNRYQSVSRIAPEALRGAGSIQNYRKDALN